MYELLTQIKGKLEKIEENEKIKNITLYNRGVHFFNLDERPKCNVCGSDLQFIKKGKYLKIHKCLNENCPTNDPTLKKGAPIKWKAFLPKYVLDQQYQNYKDNNSFNLDYLINKKGYTKEQALEYINKQKEERKKIGKKNKGKNKEYYINKLGEEEYWKKFKICNHLCVEYWINKGYTKEEAKNEISKIQSNNARKVKNHFKLTKEYVQSKNINPDIFFKERSKRCVEYYLKRGYTEEEAHKKVSELQSDYSSRVQNRRSNKQIQYWVDKGYTIQEAKKIISKLQCTFSKETCIKKYGEEEGLKVFKERQLKWQKTLRDNGTIKCGYSKISQELFKKILRFYKSKDRINVFYATKNKEYNISYNNINYLYDFVDIENKKIIEFQGDLYHANPKLYTNENYINPYDIKLHASDIWEKDKIKKEVAIKNGFDVLYIWEYDYRRNKENEINKCKEFLNI